MGKRNLWMALAALLVVVSAVFGFSLTRDKEPAGPKTNAEVAEVQNKAVEAACASSATYDRLKQVVFEEAVRIRNADPANLDTLATNSVVRMENPVVKSRDEKLNVTVCTGRFVLELPPGAERGFGGQRRLAADVEYAAQGAVDGSGLVYRLNGAEPIVYRLAAFDLQRQQQAPGAAPQPQLADATPPPVPRQERAEVETGPPPPEPEPEPEPAPKVRRPEPVARPAPAPLPAPVRVATARPSFNCSAARTRSERMVCGNSGLAASDRAMSSLYFSALASADDRQKAALRTTRNRFLAYRERCGSEACIADAYQGRMMEIRDIMAGRF
jgi:uncharacterized protein YecT (DUF1311 family)